LHKKGELSNETGFIKAHSGVASRYVVLVKPQLLRFELLESHTQISKFISSE